MNLAMIAAVQKSNRGIGIEGQLPWYIPADLTHFKKKTLNKFVIMGKRTFSEDLKGLPLPERMNIVLTHRPLPTLDQRRNVLYTHVIDPDFYLRYARILLKHGLLSLPELDTSEMMVIGGEAIYNLFLPLVKRLYITEIEGEQFECDRFFPDYSNWILDKASQTFTQGNIQYTFKEFIRPQEIE